MDGESQFSNPHGFLGHLLGLLYAIENRERNRWSLSLLNIHSVDRRLEIGIGPGWAIQQASLRASDGCVAGIDHLATMIRQARWRNRRGLQTGQVELKQGDAGALPFGDESFDKVYAINSFHEWPDRALGLREARRVLKPGGLIAIVEHPHGRRGDKETDALRARLAAELGQAGFQSVQFQSRYLQGRTAIAVLGRKQSS